MQTHVDAPRYSFSFLTGALYVRESLAVAELLDRHGEWEEVERRVVEENLLRQRTTASGTRLGREIRYRLQEFSPEEVEFFCGADPRDQRHLLFIAICQRFRFISEFVDEVLRPKVLGMELQLYPSDFARFFDRKSQEAPEFEALTDKSRAKIKQVLTRMLAEAGLLDSTESQILQRPVPSRALVRVVAEHDPRRLRFLLLPDADIRQLTH